MNRSRRVRVDRGKLSLRIVGEQRVDTKPAASLRPRDELVREPELGEPSRRVRTVERPVAEFRGELAEHRGAVEKRTVVLVERRENLTAQIVGDEPVVSAERPDRPPGILDGPQPQPGENERRGPALGALDEHVDLLRAELELTETHEQLVRLSGRERELRCTHLDERPGRAQPRQPQRRIDPRDQHHVHVRGKVPEGIVDRRQGLLADHRVQIVEHNDQLTPQRRHLVHQLIDRDLDRAARHAQPPQRAPPQPRPHPIDRCRDVPPQQNRIVVASVKRHPGQRRVEICAPGPDLSRLAVPGRGNDEGQLRVAAGI